MRIPIDTRQLALDFIPKHATGAEIGVHHGRFSQLIFQRVQPRKLSLIDPWKYMEEATYSRSHYGGPRVDQEAMDRRYAAVKRKFKHQIGNGRIEVIRADAASASEQFEDNSLDFVYIDGDHSYAGVKSDLEHYYPKIKRGGLIIGDDYEDGRWWGDGVIRAFNEFLAANPVEVEFKLGVQIGVKV